MVDQYHRKDGIRSRLIRSLPRWGYVVIDMDDSELLEHCALSSMWIYGSNLLLQRTVMSECDTGNQARHSPSSGL